MKRTYWKTVRAVFLALCFLTAFLTAKETAYAGAASGTSVELAHVHGDGCYHHHSGDSKNGGGCYGNASTTACGRTFSSSGGCNYRCSVCLCDIVMDKDPVNGYKLSGTEHCPNDRSHALEKNWILNCSVHGTWYTGWGVPIGTCPARVTTYSLSCGLNESELECEQSICGSFCITCAESGESVRETTLTADTVSSGAGADVISFSWSTGQESQTITVSENGTYSCTVTYRDGISGSQNSATAGYTVANIDRTPPDVTLSASPDEPTSGDVTIRIDASDNVGVSAYSFDGSSFSGERTLTVNENGTYRAYARDGAGNVGSAQITISNIDRDVPHAELSVENRDWHSRDGKNKIIVSAYDDESGLAALPYSFNGQEWSAQSIYEIEQPGTYYVKVRDRAGNVGQVSITVSRIQDPTPTPRPTPTPTPRPTAMPTSVPTPQPTIGPPERPAEQTLPEEALPTSAEPSDADTGEGMESAQPGGEKDMSAPPVTQRPSPAPTGKPSADTTHGGGGRDGKTSAKEDGADAGAGSRSDRDGKMPDGSDTAEHGASDENNDTDIGYEASDGAADADGAEQGAADHAGGETADSGDGNADPQTVFVPNDVYLSQKEDTAGLLVKTEKESPFDGRSKVILIAAGAAAVSIVLALLWLSVFGVCVYTKDEKGRFRFAGITKVAAKEHEKTVQVPLTKGIIRNSVTNELRLHIGLFYAKRLEGSRAELIYKTMSREFEIARTVFVRMRA